MHKSIINNSHEINENKWLVSICRDKNADNTEHAFLIIEGLGNDKQPFIKKAHLTLNNQKAKSIAAMSGIAKISCRNVKLNYVQQEVEGYVTQSYEITKQEGEKLITAIHVDLNKDIVYNLAGNSRAYSGLFASQDTQNCLTWAEAKLKAIGIKIDNQWLDIIVAIPSQHVPEPANDSLLDEDDKQTSGKCLFM